MTKTLPVILSVNVLLCTQLYYQPDQGASDDTGVNGLKVTCRGPGMDGSLTQNIQQNDTWPGSTWSTWSSTCPPGTAVCALKTRFLGHSSVDDIAYVTDVRLQCCYY